MLYLFFGWCLYFFTHSFLADSRIKACFYRRLNASITGYRRMYNLIAVVGLVILVYFSLLEPHRIWTYAGWEWIPAVPLIISGAYVGFCALKKFELREFLGFSKIRKVARDSGIASDLVVNGIYRHVRHPLYSGTLLFAIGFFLLFPTESFAVFLISMGIYLPIGIFFEEKKLTDEFGAKYREYKKKTSRLIPWIY